MYSLLYFQIFPFYSIKVMSSSSSSSSLSLTESSSSGELFFSPSSSSRSILALSTSVSMDSFSRKLSEYSLSFLPTSRDFIINCITRPITASTRLARTVIRKLSASPVSSAAEIPAINPPATAEIIMIIGSKKSL